MELLGSTLFYHSWSCSLKALVVKLELAPNRSQLSISGLVQVVIQSKKSLHKSKSFRRESISKLPGGMALFVGLQGIIAALLDFLMHALRVFRLVLCICKLRSKFLHYFFIKDCTLENSYFRFGNIQGTDQIIHGKNSFQRLEKQITQRSDCNIVL